MTTKATFGFSNTEQNYKSNKGVSYLSLQDFIKQDIAYPPVFTSGSNSQHSSVFKEVLYPAVTRHLLRVLSEQDSLKRFRSEGPEER